MGLMQMTISGSRGSARLSQSGEDGTLLLMGVEGWYGTPDLKVSPVERQAADGGHAVADEAILYATRVVTVDIFALGGTDEGMLKVMEPLSRMSHENVTVSLDDGGSETEVRGFLEIEWDRKSLGGRMPGKLTVTCSDPRRYGARRTAYMAPSDGGTGGLVFDGDSNLQYPIQFAGGTVSGNVATLVNEGTSTAYPVIRTSGSFPGGIQLNGSFGQLEYPVPIGTGAALVLDSLTETASVLGVDATRALTRRDFPSVEPGGSVTISLLASGTGTVTVEMRDTYI